jgi:hypothetical protein
MAFRSGRRPRRFVPRLEPLDDRALPSVTFTETDGTLTILGDQRANTIVVTDTGTEDAGAIQVTADGQTYTSVGAVTRIVITGRGGADNVTYTLTGDLSGDRAVEANLGNQHDSFTANLQGGLAGGAALSVRALGGNGHDTLTLNAAGVDVAAGATLSVDFNGGNGNDVLLTTFSGLLAGTATFTSNGGNGKDSVGGRISLGTSEPDENGETTPSNGSLTVNFLGGNGVDAMALSVEGADGLGTPLVATVNGGNGKDVFDTTTNVAVADPSVGPPKGPKKK